MQRLRALFLLHLKAFLPKGTGVKDGARRLGRS